MTNTRGRLWTIVAAAAALVLFPVAASVAADTTETLFGSSVPKVAADPDTTAVTLGVKFSSAVDGQITGLRFYKATSNKGTHTGALWTSSGTKLASVTWTGETASGWQEARFSTPVNVTKGTTYVAGYLAPRGRYADDTNGFAAPVTRGDLTAPKGAGVYKYGGSLAFPKSNWENSNYYVDVVFQPGAGAVVTPPPTPDPTPTPTPTPTTTPTPDPTPSPDPTPTPTPTPTPDPTPTGQGITVLGREFPSPATTGVPAGTTLTNYTGPCTIQTANVVFDHMYINCYLRVLAKGIVIKDSYVFGGVYADYNDNVGSFTITDSTVDAGQGAGTGIGDAYFTATRVHVTGGTRSVNCYAACTVQDSYVADQWNDHSGVNHESGMRVNTNSHLIHNTIGCTAQDYPPDAGCSAAITGYPDFDPVQGNVIQNNLILAGSGGYCAYGGSTGGKPYSGQTKNITFKDNIWQRGTEMGDGNRGYVCGFWGPITSFDISAPGAVWSNNLYDDGTPVQPAN